MWYGRVSFIWSRLISRIKSSCFLINLQIGIGVLALPNTLHAIGMIPGIICILASGLITTYLDTVIGTFKRGHPEVYSIADTGYVMFGRFGKELFGGMYWVLYTTSHNSEADSRYFAFSLELVRSWHSQPP